MTCRLTSAVAMGDLQPRHWEFTSEPASRYGLFKALV